MKFEISVPATLSNFGPGFDTLGMAIDRHLKVKFESSPDIIKNEFIVSGDYKTGMPLGAANIIFAAAEKHFKTPFRISMHNDIPLKRGLGSSSAANAVAITLAKIFEMASVEKLNEMDTASLVEFIRPKVYNEAIAAEGHPDNITPCLFGGFVAARIDNGEGAFLNIPFPAGMKLHIMIPEIEVETRMARKILPDSYKLADVVKNLQNLSCMVAEFCLNAKDGQTLPIFSNLKSLLSERIHEQYRLNLCPTCAEVIKSLNSCDNIYGAFLSGSGTTICAIASDDVSREINNALHIFSAQNVEVKYHVHSIEYSGLKLRKGDF